MIAALATLGLTASAPSFAQHHFMGPPTIPLRTTHPTPTGIRWLSQARLRLMSSVSSPRHNPLPRVWVDRPLRRKRRPNGGTTARIRGVSIPTSSNVPALGNWSPLNPSGESMPYLLQSSTRSLTRITPLLCLIVVGGCAMAPRGPSMLALPGTGKSFETFQIDDSDCRGYATAQTGGVDANQAAADSTVRSAALGTVIGTVAGAAIGGNRGAGAGAGTGLLFGTMAGAGAGDTSARGSQRSYDHAYIQCMYAKGHQVPIAGESRSMQR